jgi:hypothetical protein
MIPNLKPEMAELIAAIATKNMYSGNKIPSSIMEQFTIVEDDLHIGILVPYWLGVLERGRGVRKRNVDHGLWKIIKRWMEKHNKFKSTTAKGRDNEAKRLTWYINKYGNKQFNRGNPIFVDVYTSERKKTIEKIDKKFALEINKITMDVI